MFATESYQFAPLYSVTAMNERLKKDNKRPFWFWIICYFSNRMDILL